MSIRSITKGIVSVGMWSATKLVVTGLVLPIYSRMLGTDGYGQYAYYVALLLIASHPAGFGMRHTLTKYIAERPNERAWQRQLAKFARSVMLVSGLIVGAIVIALLTSSSGAGLHGLGIAAVVAGILWCEQMHQYASGILYGFRREEDATVPAALGVVIGGALGAALAATGFGVMGGIKRATGRLAVRRGAHPSTGPSGTRLHGGRDAGTAAATRTAYLRDIVDGLFRGRDGAIFR